MKLVASLIVRNELGRYLEQSIDHLLEFCDELRVLDDGSTDGSFEWLVEQPRVEALQLPTSRFFAHEGQARQALLDWTLQASPSHVLAIDADEFVADGAAVRRACATAHRALTLEIEEVWELDGDCLCIREDGGWRTHPIAMVWRVPPRIDRNWRILDKQLACGRIPVPAGAQAARSGTSVLHFGWANETERFQRHRRYEIADGGRFHTSAHLDSILWPPERVDLRGRPWPNGLERLRPALAERASQRLYRRVCASCGADRDFQMEDGSWVCEGCGSVSEGE